MSTSVVAVRGHSELGLGPRRQVSKTAPPFVTTVTRRTGMGKVTVVGTFTCEDGTAEETERVLAAMVEAARGEPGVEVYSYHRGEDGRYWFFALVADEAALAGHGRSPAMQAAMAALRPLTTAPPQVSVAVPLAAVGLDL
jgi:quinol monooxygenase YgiN